MKNLQEMSLQEMRETEGGFPWLAVLFVAAILLLADAFAKDNNPDTVTTVNGQRAGN
jgi:hypothetical protein